MNKKMISCSFCFKQYKHRTTLEKHQSKCNSQNVQSLLKRVKELEEKLSMSFETPELTFQEYVNQIDIAYTEDKVDAMFTQIFKSWLEKGVEKGCVVINTETFVFDEMRGWILFKNISMENIEKIARVIQSRLLAELPRTDDYFKNVLKITNLNLPKWTKNIYKYIC